MSGLQTRLQSPGVKKDRSERSEQRANGGRQRAKVCKAPPPPETEPRLRGEEPRLSLLKYQLLTIIILWVVFI